MVGGRRSLALAAGAVIGLAIGALVALLGIPSFVVTLAFFLALQAVPLKLIGSGGSLRVNDEVLRGLSIKNVPRDRRVDRGRADRGRVRGALAVALPLARRRRAWSTSRSHWSLVQIVVLGVDRPRAHRAAQRRTARPTR